MDVPGEDPRRATVIHRVEDLDGAKVGMYHQNPLMYTHQYDLEYDYGTHDWYLTNVIYENLYSQVASEGHPFLILEDISDNWSDRTAITVDDGFIISRGDNKLPKKTMRGWELLNQTRILRKSTGLKFPSMCQKTRSTTIQNLLGGCLSPYKNGIG